MLLASSQRLECTDVDKHWKGAGDVLCSHATYLKWTSLYLSASLDVQVCLALLPCTETAASTREGGDCYAAAAEWGKPAWYWQLNLFTVVQEVSPWDMGFFMDILVRMDYFYYCTVLSAGFGEMNKCFEDSFVDPGHLWLLGCNISSAVRRWVPPMTLVQKNLSLSLFA